MNRAVVLLFVASFMVASLVVVFEPVSADSMVENSWESMKSMPTARTGLGVAVVDGKIYAIGGFNGANGQWHFVDANEMYDPETDSWTSKQQMPTARAFFGIAVYQNKIYVMGGQTGFSGYTAVNEVYDPLTDTWEKKTSIPSQRAYLDANAIEDKIYLIGGKTTPELFRPDSNENYVYEAITDSWVTKTQIPRANQGYASAISNSKIIIIGGGMAVNPTSDNQVYDSITDTWSQRKPLPNEVYGAAAGTTTGVLAPKRIYIIGGYFSKDTNYTQVYEFETDTWTFGASMPTPRRGLAVAIVNDFLYAIGGSYGSDKITISAVNEKYTPFGYGTPDLSYMSSIETALPKISVLSPQNKAYNESSLLLVFTLDKAVNWIGHALDGAENVTISGNTTLTGLSNGSHNITVYAKDIFGNVGTSEIITFTVSSQLLPTMPMVVASGASVALVCAAGLLVYFKKRRR